MVDGYIQYVMTSALQPMPITGAAAAGQLDADDGGPPLHRKPTEGG